MDIAKDGNIVYKRLPYYKDKDSVKRIYASAFPKSERFPFWILKNCSKNSNVHFDAILCDDKLIGMQFVVNYDNISYLMYLATDTDYRNLGLGSQILKNLVIRNDNVLLCIEKPKDDGKNDVKSRRKNFYLRNGFYSTGSYLKDSEVDYEILSSVKDFVVSEDVLRNRYLKMSNSSIMQRVIKNTFDVNNINLYRRCV